MAVSALYVICAVQQIWLRYWVLCRKVQALVLYMLSWLKACVLILSVLVFREKNSPLFGCLTSITIFLASVQHCLL